jgi:hypothetical protein
MRPSYFGRDAMPDGGHLTIAARNTTVATDNAKRLDLTPDEYILVRVSDAGVGMRMSRDVGLQKATYPPPRSNHTIRTTIRTTPSIPPMP